MPVDRQDYSEFTLAEETDGNNNHLKIQIQKKKIYAFSDAGMGTLLMNEQGDTILVLESYDEVSKKLNPIE